MIFLTLLYLCCMKGYLFNYYSLFCYYCRTILQNVISSVAPFTSRSLLYGVDEFDFTENKKIINETLKFIHETKRFE